MCIKIYATQGLQNAESESIGPAGRPAMLPPDRRRQQGHPSHGPARAAAPFPSHGHGSAQGPAGPTPTAGRRGPLTRRLVRRSGCCCGARVEAPLTESNTLPAGGAMQRARAGMRRGMRRSRRPDGRGPDARRPAAAVSVSLQAGRAAGAAGAAWAGGDMAGPGLAGAPGHSGLVALKHSAPASGWGVGRCKISAALNFQTIFIESGFEPAPPEKLAIQSPLNQRPKQF